MTAVAILPGNAPDAEQALALVEQTEQDTECEVEQTIADCAYGSGATRQAFADAKRPLVAKVPALTNRGRFPKTEFAIDLDAISCTCPAGQISTDLRGGKQRAFHFAVEVCAACPLRSMCVRGRGGRSVQVHAQERLLQAARAFQHSPPFRECQRRRQVVEHRLARIIQLGMRQARYVGRPKTLFQLAMAAAVANLVLMSRAVAVLWTLLWASTGLLLGLLASQPLFRRRSMTASHVSIPCLFVPSLNFRLAGSRPHF